jgi:hypothetical protein
VNDLNARRHYTLATIVVKSELSRAEGWPPNYAFQRTGPTSSGARVRALDALRLADERGRWPTTRGFMTHLKALSLFSVLFWTLILPSGASAKGALQLYAGAQRPKEEVVTLLPPADTTMVLLIDGKKAGGSCFTNCMFQRPVQILPGAHVFESTNMHRPPFRKDHLPDPVPFDSVKVAILQTTSTSFLVMSLAFKFEADLEKGSTYELRVSYVETEGKRQMYGWWHKVTSALVNE